MIIYFKKYTILVAVIAIALPVIVSTVWPLATGQIMAASIGGLALLFALFILGFLGGYAILERKAEGIVDGYIAKYNEACDPEAFITEGEQLARQITFPCNQIGSWFMGYYAQALLDVGKVDEVNAIAEGLRQSIDSAKKSIDKAGIAANLLPLTEKLADTDASLALVDEALGYCEQAGPRGTSQLRDFFNSQKKVLDARKSGNQREIADLSERIRASAAYPTRIRVEYAWDEASAQYRLGDTAEERRCLEFVVSHGSKLALASKAQARLKQLTV